MNCYSKIKLIYLIIANDNGKGRQSFKTKNCSPVAHFFIPLNRQCLMSATGLIDLHQ